MIRLTLLVVLLSTLQAGSLVLAAGGEVLLFELDVDLLYQSGE